MPPAKEIAIFKKFYELTLQIFNATKLFPKSQRFLMANRLEELIIAILEKIIQANAARNKLGILNEMTMQNSKFDDFKEKFKQRLYNFTLRLIEFLDSLPKDNVSRRIGDQLLRSGTSILANYIEGQSGKIGIATIFGL